LGLAVPGNNVLWKTAGAFALTLGLVAPRGILAYRRVFLAVIKILKTGECAVVTIPDVNLDSGVP
jgi:hypothetical protein